MVIYSLPILAFILIALWQFKPHIYALFAKEKKETFEPFPKSWENILLNNVSFYKKRSKAEQKRFQYRMQLFLNSVHIEAVQFTLEDRDIVYVAASAIIPVFGFKSWHYSNLSTVLIYPDYFNEDLAFDANTKNRTIAGLVGTGRFKNQMLLSRKALHHGFNNATDKNNTAIHEFIHLLDGTDGTIDGIPEQLLKHQYIAPWLALMHKGIEAINNDASDIRSYGGTSQTEFFAVASEYFFERPKLFKRKHPELYEMLEKCYSTENPEL